MREQPLNPPEYRARYAGANGEIDDETEAEIEQRELEEEFDAMEDEDD